jgi:phosphoserine aminotransferase
MGGLSGLIQRSEKNLATVAQWVENNAAFEFLAADPSIRSNTSVCLSVVDAKFKALSADDQTAKIKKIVSTLDSEGVACDFASYRDAPPGFRIWCGPTVDAADLAIVLDWLAWTYEQA